MVGFSKSSFSTSSIVLMSAPAPTPAPALTCLGWASPIEGFLEV